MCDSDSRQGDDAAPGGTTAQAPSSAASLHCPICDYDLTGLPTNRCPECGREFDPAVVAGQPALRVRAWLTQGSWFRQSLTVWRVFGRPAFAMGEHARLDIGAARLFPRLVLWTVAWMAVIQLAMSAAGVGAIALWSHSAQFFPSPRSFVLTFASYVAFRCLTWAGLSFVFAMLLLAGGSNDKTEQRTFTVATVLVGVVVVFLAMERQFSTEIWYQYFNLFRPLLIGAAVIACTLVLIVVDRQRLALRNAREIASFVFALAVAPVAIADLAPSLVVLSFAIVRAPLTVPFSQDLVEAVALGVFAISAWRGLAPLQRNRRIRLLLLFVGAACSAWIFKQDLAQLCFRIYQPRLRGLGLL